MKVVKRLGRSWPNNLWREHGRVLLLYAGLSLLVTWPTIQHFTTAITSDGGDARHLVWWLWRTREALLGQQPLFYAPLVYYPLGISLLANAEGPVAGLFALPFWGWGPEAAYNGTLLLGVTLTGYCMYVLARGLGFDRLVAFFAGLMLLMAPMHLAGLLAHVDKTFLGLFPLTLLAVQRALDPTGGRRRAIVVGGLLLITLLYDGWHFVLAALAVGFFLIAAWFSSERPHWPRLFKREVLIGMCCLLCVGPLLIAIVSASRSFGSSFNRNLISAELQPDLAEFFLPGQSTQLFGPGTASFLAAHEVTGTIETAVALAYVGLVLCGAALISRDRSAWRWLLFCLICVSLALGPSLKVLGQTQFTEYRLPLILPYAFLTALPGLDFMRTPGRFMLIGYVGFGIAASYGLAWLTHHARKWRYPIVLLAIAGLLIETWPQAWPQEKLRPVPPFYQQLANDPAEYGVFDLPLSSSPDIQIIGYSSHYQIYQMTHRKGIPLGYLAYNYVRHPLFPCFFAGRLLLNPDVLINGQPLDCYANGEYELARRNYRYLVFHKPQPEYPDYQPGGWGEAQATTFVEQVIGARTPIVDDQLTRVYTLTAVPATTTLRLGANWYNRENDWRWAASPATLEIITPRRQSAQLVVTLGLLFDLSAADPVAVANPDRHGVLNVTIGDRLVADMPVTVNRELRVPLELEPGLQTLTLTLQAGNFRLSDYGGGDDRALSFAIRSIDLQLEP